MIAAHKTIAPAAPRDVRGALAAGGAQLEAAGVPSAPLAAELLLLHVLGRDRAWLYGHPEGELTAEHHAAYVSLLERRAAGEPTQYITGRQEFWGLEFEVTPAVLIPRPETEHVVEVALAKLQETKSGDRRSQPLAIADVGTGSGCLAVALACELPLARIVATDVSAAALEVARRNAARHGVAGRIEFAEMNLLSSYAAARPRPEPRFDLIISNPPYVAREDAARLQREVREHEPHTALFGGPTGVEIYGDLAAQAAALLHPGGILVLELGYNSAERVRLLLENDAWSGIGIARDLAGIERVLSAQRTLLLS